MEVGSYGKLPSHGDFLRRRVNDAFVDVWDEWLRQSVAASRSALGQDWLDVYLTSPVWRFACDAAVCGPHGYAGTCHTRVTGKYRPTRFTLSDAGWRAVKSRMTTAPSCADTWVGERLQSYRSSGATDVGLARRTNQDAFIERTEIGVWAVADGMGGHARGEIASRMICDALAALEPGDTLQATVDMMIQQLRGINGYLSRVAVAARSGSTVVALVTRGGRCAVLWAGDSRLYRLRDGKLLQLTEDHVAEADGNDVSSHAISRAVGGDESFNIDVVYDSVRPGDRFLLCSDGLNHEIADDLIARQLMEPDGSRCVRQLIAAALRAGGKDNVSVIVVDADDPA